MTKEVPLSRRGALRIIGGISLGSIVAAGGVPTATAADSVAAVEQQPSVAWERTFEGVGAVNAMTVAHGDGYVIGGGNRLARLDTDGEVRWKRSYSVGLVEAITRIDGGYAVAAQSGEGTSTAFAVDTDGEQQWQTELDDRPGKGWLVPASIVNKEEIITICGRAESDDDFDSRTYGYVASLYSDGDLRWYTTVEPNQQLVSFFDLTPADGGYAVVGREHSEQSPLFLRVDDDGSIAEEQLYRGHSGFAFAITSGDDGFILGGATLDETDDAFLLRTDRAGTEHQYRQYGCPKTGERISALVKVDGGYAFAGSHLDGPEVSAWVGQVDMKEKLSWTETYRNGLHSNAQTLVVDGKGLVFGGSTSINFASRGWVVRLAATDSAVGNNS